MTTYPTLDEARAAGLMHCNCRHSVSAYQEGITRPMGDVADPEGYAASQKLRYYERKVRESKRMQAAAMDPAAQAKATRRLNDYRGKIRDHVATTSAKRQPWRESMGVSKKALAKPPLQPLSVPEGFLPSAMDSEGRYVVYHTVDLGRAQGVGGTRKPTRAELLRSIRKEGLRPSGYGQTVTTNPVPFFESGTRPSTFQLEYRIPRKDLEKYLYRGLVMKPPGGTAYAQHSLQKTLAAEFLSRVYRPR